MANLADLDRLFAQIKSEQGRLDVLFANAGGGEFMTLGSYTEEHFDKTFNTNVKGLVFTVQKALPLLPDGAAIVLNASIVSVKGFPAFGVYNATNVAAVRSFARTWTNELKERRIRVNVVSPGPIDTPAIKGLGSERRAGTTVSGIGMIAGVPLGRMGEPDEIAKAVVFLSSLMTAATLRVWSCSLMADTSPSKPALGLVAGWPASASDLGHLLLLCPVHFLQAHHILQEATLWPVLPV